MKAKRFGAPDVDRDYYAFHIHFGVRGGAPHAPTAVVAGACTSTATDRATSSSEALVLLAVRRSACSRSSVMRMLASFERTG